MVGNEDNASNFEERLVTIDIVKEVFGNSKTLSQSY